MPSIYELPEFICTKGWQWRTFSPSFGIAQLSEFWIGTDLEGNQWLTKLRGGFYAYREIVFAKISQSMGLSCQSSTYIKLDSQSAKQIGGKAGDIHSVHWFLKEHAPEPCGIECPYHQLNEATIFEIKDLYPIPISNILDWPSSDFLAYLLGANEISDYLITEDHEFVTIDSEQMFSTNYHCFSTLNWFLNTERIPSSEGISFAKELCLRFVSLSVKDIQRALVIPDNIQIEKRWDIEEIIWKSYEYAKQYK
jgi:hypothetical protein